MEIVCVSQSIQSGPDGGCAHSVNDMEVSLEGFILDLSNIKATKGCIGA